MFIRSTFISAEVFFAYYPRNIMTSFLWKENFILPRYARQKSPTGYYHIMIRGINRQDIFFDNDDRQRLLYTVKGIQKELNIQITAYSQMSNQRIIRF